MQGIVGHLILVMWLVTVLELYIILKREKKIKKKCKNAVSLKKQEVGRSPVGKHIKFFFVWYCITGSTVLLLQVHDAAKMTCCM